MEYLRQVLHFTTIQLALNALMSIGRPRSPGESKIGAFLTFYKGDKLHPPALYPFLKERRGIGLHLKASSGGFIETALPSIPTPEG